MFYSIDIDYFKTTNFKPIFITCVIFFVKVTQCMKNVSHEDLKLRSSQLWDRAI
jgi:hypothetical protein